MVLKSIGSGIVRTITGKPRQRARVDEGSDKHYSESIIRRGQNCRRFIPKVVKDSDNNPDRRCFN